MTTQIVAILMTLEGEYYRYKCLRIDFNGSRNPHDIGRRILHRGVGKCSLSFFVAILMTLEGEYYWQQKALHENRDGRNPHDIGRRILRVE